MSTRMCSTPMSPDGLFGSNDENHHIRDVFVKWNEAVQHHTCGRYSEALCTYTEMHELSARVLYNMAMAYIHLYDHTSAKKCLTEAIEKDERLAIAFYQRGLLNLENKNYGDAIDDLEATRALLRGNTYINYRPLGLFARLHIFSILYNLSLAYLLADDEEEAGSLLTEAIYDADHAQRKHITETVKLIKEGRVHEIQQLHFSTEKVFAPPKSITCNLESPVSWKGSTVVFSADRGDSAGNWDGMKTVRQSRLHSSLKSSKKKLFRKMKSLNDIKVSMVNSDLYDRRFSDSQMDTIRENRHHLLNKSVIPTTRTSRKSPLFREHSLTLPEDSIIEDVEPEYEEITHNTSIPWHDDSKEGSDKQQDVHASNLDILAKVDGHQMKTPSSKASCNVADIADIVAGSTCTSTPALPSNILSRGNSTTVAKQQAYRKSYSASTVESQPSEKLSSSTRATQSTGDLDNNRRKSILPLEEKKTYRISGNVFTRCFGKSHDKYDVATPYPTVLMSGCRAMADMMSGAVVPLCNEAMAGNILNEASNRPSEPVTPPGLDQRDGPTTDVIENERPTKTLGAVFGDKSTVVKYALTTACDCLTAIATPTVDREEVLEKTDKARRKSADASSTQKPKDRVKSFKNKRAPSPPVSALGASLAASKGLFAAFAQLSLDNIHEKTDVNNNTNDTNKYNNQTCGSRDGKTDIDLTGGSESSSDNVDVSFEFVELSTTTSNSTYCELEMSDLCRSLSNTSAQNDKESKGTTIRLNSDSDNMDIEPSQILVPEDDGLTVLTAPGTNKDETLVCAKADFVHQTPVASNRRRSKRGSTSSRSSGKVRRPSYRTNIFSFSRAKTPPPAYPPPVLRPDIRKGPTSARKRSRKSSSGRKKSRSETGPTLTESALLVPFTTLCDIAAIPLEARASLSSISEYASAHKLPRQSTLDKSKGGQDETLDANNNEMEMFDSVFDDCTPRVGGGREIKAPPNTPNPKLSLAGNRKPSESAEYLTEDQALFAAFLKSNTGIKAAFDNFVRHSTSTTDPSADSSYMCMEGVHNKNCDGDCFYV